LINLVSYFEVVPLEQSKKKKQDVNREKISLDFGFFFWANKLLDAKKLENLLLS
jgi:hypothetical protein